MTRLRFLSVTSTTWLGSATTTSFLPNLTPRCAAIAFRSSNPLIKFSVWVLSRFTATPSPAFSCDSFSSFVSSQTSLLDFRWQMREPSIRHCLSSGRRTNCGRKTLRVVAVSPSTMSAMSADVDDVFRTVYFSIVFHLGHGERSGTNRAWRHPAGR